MGLAGHQWWMKEVPDGSRAQMAYSYVRAIEESQWGVRQRQYRNAFLYSGEVPQGAWRIQWRSAPRWWRREPVMESVIESVIDSCTSDIGSQPVRVTFQTDGAEWKARRQAHWRERFVEGEFDRMDMDAIDPLVFRDACWGEVGCVAWDDDGERVRATRVSPMELVVDERTVVGGNPYFPQLHRIQFKDRDLAVAELGPEAKKAIDRTNSEWLSYVRPGPEMVCIITSWKLPVRDRKGKLHPGMKITYTQGGLLEEPEPWLRPEFPFSWYKWKEPISGFYGRSLCDQLAWIQARMNKMQRFISFCQDLVAAPKVLIALEDKGMSVSMSNDVGQHLYYKKTPPQFITPPSVDPSVYQDYERKWQRAFQISGKSQMAASSVKPSGLDSAPSLREFRDTETGRFLQQFRAFERMRIHHARQLIAQQRDLAERGAIPTATWRSRNYAKKIKWSDVDDESMQWEMSLEPASILSRTPAGRVQQVTELAQAGLIDRASALRLVGHPDFERIIQLYDAPFDDIEAAIENLLDGKTETPDRYQDLDLGTKLVHLALLKAKRDGAPDIPILEGMRRWIRQAEMLQQAAQQQAAPAQVPGGAAPPIAPQAPVSPVYGSGGDGPPAPPPGGPPSPMPQAAQGGP